MILVLVSGCTRRPESAGRAASTPAVSLMEARRGFETRPVPHAYQADGPAPAPPAGIYTVVRYPSPVGRLVAYLTPDPGDGKRHPAVLWAHAGFGGIGDYLWREELRQDPLLFYRAGLVVMCPSWRGENDNPGQFQLFYGEVEDALAAVDYLSKLPYVDSSRIYMAGHSSGGTLTLLTVEATDRLRAAFSFGGAPDLASIVSDGKGYGNTPFDYRSEQEVRLRSPIHYLASIRTPTFYFEGIDSAYVQDARRMERLAQEAGAPVSVFILAGGNHYNVVQPILALLAKKIQADTGPTCNITLTSLEVREAFAEGIRQWGER